MNENIIGNNLSEISELLNINVPEHDGGKIEHAWYVGACDYDENNQWTDFSEQFIKEGRWEKGWQEKFADDVKKMQPGDRIAIKASYTKKKNLPFNNNNKTVGVMAIKATGIITENLNDGKNIKVDWKKVSPVKEWYGAGVLRQTVHHVSADDGYLKKALLRFTFENEPQDYTICEEQYSEDIKENDTVPSSEAELTVKNDSIAIEYYFEQLLEILYDMYTSANAGSQSNAIRMFGFKYAENILTCGFAPQKIVDASVIESKSFGGEITKAINMYNSIKNNEFGVAFAENCELVTEFFDFNQLKGNGISKIFYGTPGCGKSYFIEHNILGKNSATKEYSGDYKKENIIRTTFYQDYSNTDFVGQILPKIVKDKISGKDIVEYVFNPGPFTLALIQAIRNPSEKVALIVEEINRGNAPAIFGDIFQLLDRDDDCISEYGIVNVSMTDYLSSLEFEVDGEKKKYIFNEIKIPGNMDIFATMNTSDQNVYTLDTAFVRRWDKEKIKNSFANCRFASTPVPGMKNYSWQEFVEGINRCIADHLDDLQINEDKQLGTFFIKESLLLSDDAEKFAYKVFDYLWNDVAKFDRGIFFNSYNTLEALIDSYAKNGVSVFKSGIFPNKPEN